MINNERLLRNPPPSFGVHPPWIPVATFAAANFLNVHPKTLLGWRRHGIGPRSIEKGRFLHNELFWFPGELLSWWEEATLGKGRGYQEICHDWAMANKLLLLHSPKSEMPEKPTVRHLKRRALRLTPGAPRRPNGGCRSIFVTGTAG